MQQPSFDVHAKILHKGQYELKKVSAEVPIKNFNEGYEIITNVQTRIKELNGEILELEEQLRQKRLMNQEQADKIIEQAQDKAKKVLEDAEQHAFDRVQKSVQEKESLIQKASEESEHIKVRANQAADEIKFAAEKEAKKIKQESQEEGYQAGYDKGLESGCSEVSFAVDRLHGIIAETARERERILTHSEQQVINLVLTMVTKVVKKLTVEHQQVVIENTKSALELLRGAMTLFIRVSPHDFNFTQSFKEELFRMIDAKAELKFIEDPTVEPGGVYIETDTGDVDATIRSQLEALETQMRFYMPVKVHTPERKPVVEKEEVLEVKDVPKTPFAQREEYKSTVEVTPEDKKDELVIDSTETEVVTNEKTSSEATPEQDSRDNGDEAITQNTQTENTAQSIQNETKESVVETEEQAINSYQEEENSVEEQSSQNQDDIVV